MGALADGSDAAADALTKLIEKIATKHEITDPNIRIPLMADDD